MVRVMVMVRGTVRVMVMVMVTVRVKVKVKVRVMVRVMVSVKVKVKVMFTVSVTVMVMFMVTVRVKEFLMDGEKMYSNTIGELFFAGGKLYGSLEGEGREALKAEVEESGISMKEFEEVLQKIALLAVKAKYSRSAEEEDNERQADNKKLGNGQD